MSAKPVQIHPEALAQIKLALRWYAVRSETAATKLVEEVDRAIELGAEFPNRWPKGGTLNAQNRLAAISIRDTLS
jgi:plasmid stabilization system protein ParE